MQDDTQPCLTPSELSAWAADTLDNTSRTRGISHIAECEVCRVTLSSLVADSQGGDAVEAIAEPPPSATPSTMGRYQLQRLLGIGGMGAVYLGYDPQLNRQVAVKLLHAQGHVAAKLVQTEAQALAQLTHPNVVAVYDSGETEHGCYIVMQYVDGISLEVWQQSNAPSVLDVVEHYCMAGEGLHAAHLAGLVHRDFKPANTLIDKTGVVAVTDFGLAQSAQQDVVDGAPIAEAPFAGATEVSRRGVMAGTPAFMAPEQHKAQPATAQSDQFSFCVALWEALFDQHPFITSAIERADPAAIRTTMQHAALRSPPTDHQVPPRILRALQRGLAREPWERWPSMRELITQLRPAPKSRVVPLLIVATTAIAATAAIAWAVTPTEATTDAVAQCSANARDRVAQRWSATQQAQLRQQFEASQLPFGVTTATSTNAMLSTYAAHLERLQTDFCRKSDEPAAARTARVACVDRALESLGRTAQGFVNAPTVGTISNALAIATDLPSLLDCEPNGSATRIVDPSNSLLLQAPHQLIHELAERAHATAQAGQFPKAKYLISQANALAAQLQSAPLQNEVAYERLRVAFLAGDPAANVSNFVTLVAALLQQNQVRLASQSLAYATQLAGFARDPQAVTSNSAWAVALAQQLGDADLEQAIKVRTGTAQISLGRFEDGRKLCEQVSAETKRNPNSGRWLRIEAATCQVRSLATQYRFAEVQSMLDQARPFVQETVGSQHPVLAEWLMYASDAATFAGDLGQARTLAQQAGEIMRRTYGANDMRTIEMLVAEAINDYNAHDDAAALTKLREVEAGYAAIHFTEPLRLAKLHANIAMVLESLEQIPEMYREIGKAIELARSAGPAALAEVANLELTQGRYYLWDDVNRGLVEVERAFQDLHRLGDARATFALYVLATAQAKAQRYQAAVGTLELALADPNLKNDVRCDAHRLQFDLARSLHALHRDPERVQALLQQARQGWQTAKQQPLLTELDAFAATIK